MIEKEAELESQAPEDFIVLRRGRRTPEQFTLRTKQDSILGSYPTKLGQRTLRSSCEAMHNASKNFS